MKADVLERFESWIDSRRRTFHKLGYEVTAVDCGQGTDKPAKRLDLESATRIARVTIWESGECDAEILGVNSEKTEFWQNYVIGKRDSIDEALGTFLGMLSN